MPASAQTGLVGFANYSDLGCQGTTGGMGGKIVHVSTREDLAKYAAASSPYIIIIDNDMEGALDQYGTPIKDNTVKIVSNKTIIGGGDGVELKYFGFDINGQQNIIIRNVKIEKASPDAIAIRNTHHVWIDHCDLSSINEDSDVWDGLLDFTYGSTYMTVSWCRFHDHDKTSLCSSGTRNITDHGRERVTYHHNAFINCTQRNPRVGYGKGVIFNDYNQDNSSYGVGVFARAELNIQNCYFKNVGTAMQQMYSADYGPEDAYWGFYWSDGNEFVKTSKGTKGNVDKPFDFSSYFDYEFAMDKAADVPSLVDKMGCVSGIESDIIPFPGDGAVNVTGSTRLMCGAVDGASSIRIQIGEDVNSLVDYNPESFRLKPLTTYYWNATIVGGDHDGKTSPLFRFTTAADAVRFPTPADGEMHAALREIVGNYSPCEPLTLRWREGLNDDSYIVSISEKSDMSGAISAEVKTTSWRPENLKYGKQYYWHVDTKTKDGSIVEGDVWSFKSDVAYAKEGRNEAEAGVRGGLCFLEYDANPSWIDASGEYCTVGDEGPGYISFVWQGEAGRYDLKTAYFDENSGQGEYQIFVNEDLKDSWKATANDNTMKEHTSDDITLSPGDEIRIGFCTNASMRCRTDYIDIAKREIKENYNITVRIAPEDGGSVSPESVVAKADESVTLTATPADDYLFKNWTDEIGAVLSTELEYTFIAKADREITANFELKPKQEGYHTPVLSDYEFEYVKTHDLTEQKTNAQTGQLQWEIRQDCSDWVEYGSTKNDGLNVTPQNIDLDPITGKRITLATYKDNMIRVGATKYVILRVEGTEKVQIYFTGGSSTPGTLAVTIESEDGEPQTVNSTLEISKKSTPRSDSVEFDINPSKKYVIKIGGTQDIAVYAFNLWPGEDNAVNSIDSDSKEGTIYNLQGIPVPNPTPGQIYIRNAQKFIQP